MFQSSDDEIIQNFSNLQILKELATVLEVDYSTLTYFLRDKRKNKYYKIFNIKKKSGKERTIIAPQLHLKGLLSKFNYIFNLVYKPKPSVYGFVKSREENAEIRNIITNAKKHVGKRFVLNIDLENFFPTITSNRIRGLFQSTSFNFSYDVANAIAKLCTYEDTLPQGSLASPIISNMICRKMDNGLQMLAQKHRCTYTRYADDITFSTNSKKFPEQLATIDIKDNMIITIPGSSISNIIEINGFNINLEKVRLQNCLKHQEVTGLIVNQKINVRRKYIRNIRAILNDWERNGLEAAEQNYYSKKNIYRKQYNPEKETPFLEKIVSGRINFIKNVKGGKDFVFAKLYNKFNELQKNEYKKLPENEFEQISEHIWILEGMPDIVCGEDDGAQGTAFLLKSIGFVTCYHCLFDKYGNFRNYVKAFQSEPNAKQYEIEVINSNKTLDLAIFKPKGFDIAINEKGFETGDCDKVIYGTNLKMAGFPDYYTGHPPEIKDTIVSRRKMQSGIKVICVDKPIVKGLSGSPVFNADIHVIGIATNGSAAQYANDTSNFSLMPIKALKYLIKENQD